MAMRAQSRVLTAIVGSYPKPRYVYRQNGRSLLDSFGFAFDRRRQELGPAEFSRLLDRAALEAIKDHSCGIRSFLTNKKPVPTGASIHL